MFQLKAEFAHKKESVNREGCIGINTGAKFVLLLNTVSSTAKLECFVVFLFFGFFSCLASPQAETVVSLGLNAASAHLATLGSCDVCLSELVCYRCLM